jgi:hypothetical protein
VSFGSLTIHEFPIAPAPQCIPKEGTPIGLGERSISTRIISIDEYEDVRPSALRLAGPRLIHGTVRIAMLLDSGYAYEDIECMGIAAHDIRWNRQETLGQLNRLSLGKRIASKAVKSIRMPFLRRTTSTTDTVMARTA